MRINTTCKTSKVAFREDGKVCLILKVRSRWEVLVDNISTGYKFRTLKEAYEYCEFGF